MKIAVLGGDGYCGWATALYLSKQGHDSRHRGQLRAPSVGSRAGRANSHAHPPALRPPDAPGTDLTGQPSNPLSATLPTTNSSATSSRISSPRPSSISPNSAPLPIP